MGKVVQMRPSKGPRFTPQNPGPAATPDDPEALAFQRKRYRQQNNIGVRGLSGAATETSKGSPPKGENTTTGPKPVV